MDNKVNSCTIEVRPAAGGEEAKIWAADLLRMYLRFAQVQGWLVTPKNELVLNIKGNDCYRVLENEAGVHRVQRVPQTEKHGRLHTSTATVAVLPEIPESEINIDPNDLEIHFFRASGHGGQNVNKVSSAVRLLHKPTGLVVESQSQRYQEQNRQEALKMIQAKLWRQQESKKEGRISEQRRIQVGEGQRSEKIRTYNYPRNQVTDHRLNKKFRLEDILDGKLGKITKLLAAF